MEPVVASIMRGSGFLVPPTEPVTGAGLLAGFRGARAGWALVGEAHPVWAVVLGTLLMFAIIVVILVVWDAVK